MVQERARGRTGALQPTTNGGWIARARIPWWFRALAVAVALAAVMALSAQTAGAAPAAGKVRHRLLTTAGPRSIFTGQLPTIRVTAAVRKNAFNRREVFYAARAPDSTDSESCATWLEEQGGVFIQPGAAFRVVRANRATRAVTVTQNVVPPLFGWVFNFHVWDTANRAQPFTQFGSQVDLRPLLAPTPSGGLAPSPWHFCARLVGSKLEFVVWLSGQPRPAWGNPQHGGSATVPAGWTQPGKTGWYIGHLRSSETALFTNLTTRKLR
jgi:hypothetical protein